MFEVLFYVSLSSNLPKHHFYIRQVVVCVNDWAVLRVADADGAWRSGLGLVVMTVLI